jgi:anthranilate synthase component 1
MDSPRISTTRSAFRDAAQGVPDGTRIPVEIRVVVDDPFEAYRRARRGSGQWDFYLETTGGQSGWGYFGIEPIDRIEIDADNGPTLPALTDRLRDERLSRGDCKVPYPCGAIGWLSYDVARELEHLPTSAADDRGLPHLQAGVYDRIAAWKCPDSNEQTTLRVTACPRVRTSAGANDGTADGIQTVEMAYEYGRERALDLARRALDGDTEVEEPATARTGHFESDCGRAAFADRVRRVREYIRDGETFQANISQRLVAPAVAHPVEVFRALRQANPAPYSALLEFPGIDLVSASPELLLHRTDDRLLTEPIAGTRPRGATSEEDATHEQDLLTDEKERAEHAMLVDLERNDLGKISEYGSVDVTEYRRVDRYSEVMHLVSRVEGRLGDGTDLEDAIAAVFPGGTITGAPKPRTMEIIEELETTRRGPYTGSVGIFGFDDRATLNIAIRTLVRYNDEYHLRVGAGIVHDSDPTQEYRETLAKARALVTAVDEALGQQAHLSVCEGTSEDDPSGDTGRTHEPTHKNGEQTPQ